MSKFDYENIKRFYSERYRLHGYSPKSLGWDKGKQQVRFDVLTSNYDFAGKKVLDIGCGFGDLATFLEKKYSDFTYHGVDLSNEFVTKACEFHQGKIGRTFEAIDILSLNNETKYDYAIASGTFNLALPNCDNYQFLEQVIEKTLDVCRDGFAFDFLSDKVDYQLKDTFHYAPEKVLEIAYKYSRNIVLRNDYMPFEFALILSKNDSFSAEDTLFCKYKNERNHL